MIVYLVPLIALIYNSEFCIGDWYYIVNLRSNKRQFFNFKTVTNKGFIRRVFKPPTSAH